MSKKKRIIRNISIGLAVFLVIFSVASYMLISYNFNKQFQRTQMETLTIKLRYTDVDDEYERELLSFKSGDNDLQGYLYGKDNNKGLVVLCHGIGGGAEEYLAETLYFVDNGYQVFAYDNTGCYGSGGDSCIGLCQSAIDLNSALTYIEGESRFSALDVFLYGHSWGGYAVTAIFNYEHDITASASVSGFNKPMDVICEWGADILGPVLSFIEYPFIYMYHHATFPDKADMSAVEGINKTDTPVLIIHGDKDNVVDYDGSGIINSKDDITNPNVQYKICSNDRQNNHNYLSRSIESIEYEDKVNEDYRALLDEYNDEVPQDKLTEFYSNVDKKLINKLDDKFMQDVIKFYENSK